DEARVAGEAGVELVVVVVDPGGEPIAEVGDEAAGHRLERRAQTRRGERDVEDDDAPVERARIGERARRRVDEMRSGRCHLDYLRTDSHRRPQFATSARRGYSRAPVARPLATKESPDGPLANVAPRPGPARAPPRGGVRARAGAGVPVRKTRA